MEQRALRESAPASVDGLAEPSMPSGGLPREESALQMLARRQEVLAKLGLLALRNVGLQALLDEAVTRIRATLDVDTCTILELSADGGAFVVRAGSGWDPPLVGEFKVVSGDRSQAGYTLLSAEPVVVEDLLTESRFEVPVHLLESGIRSGMTVIIHGRDRPFGSFGVHSRQLRRFGKEEVDYLQAGANVIASAIEQGRAQEELRRSESSFRSLIEHSPEAILVSRDRIICYVNHALVGYLGYPSAQDLLGISAFDIVHPEDRRLVAGRLRTIDDTGAPAVPREMRFLRRDGTAVLAESIGVPVVFDGKPAIAAMIRDVTERRKLEARLHLNDRLASLGTLAAGVAHEVNNPLTYVLGNLDLIRGVVTELRTARSELPAVSSDAERRVDERLGDLDKLAEEARDGGERVRSIVFDLKKFSRADGKEAPVAVDVVGVLRSAINVVRNQIRYRAQLVEEYEEIPLVAGSEARLGQVFMNLLVNAAQAIPEGAAQHHYIGVRTRTGEDGRAVIEVTDTGSGIAPEIQGRLFDPFFTTKPFGVGTGLGLSICHSIIAGAGGEIVVESQLGKGSCFRVLLPPAPAQVQVCAPPSRALSTRRARVLLVDDDVFVAGVCRRMLAPVHEVTVLHSGRAALEHLLEGAEYDVIFCDLLMPEMTGMDLFETLERRAPQVAGRFVFLSGGAFTSQARTFRERVPNPFLDKPCTAAVLLAAVGDRVGAPDPERAGEAEDEGRK